jgi:hypothetical protein
MIDRFGTAIYTRPRMRDAGSPSCDAGHGAVSAWTSWSGGR